MNISTIYICLFVLFYVLFCVDNVLFYVLFSVDNVLFYVLLVCKCVLLSPGVNPTAVRYII